MNVERTEYCHVKCFYFAVAYSVAVDSVCDLLHFSGRCKYNA